MTISPRLATGNFLRLWASAFALFFSFYLLLPIIPLYALTLGIPESEIGIIVGSFAFTSMAVRPWAGWAADRYGRRPLLVGGALLFSASALLYSWSQTAGALLLVRMVHGTGMGLYPTSATAIVADIAPADRRGEAMGFFGAAANLALALGPFLGIWGAERHGFPALFAASALAATVSLALTFSLSETIPERRRVPFGLSTALSRAAVLPSVTLFCLTATYGVQIAFLPLYVRSLGGGNPGIFFLVFALITAAIRGYAGRLSDRLGRTPVTVAGMVLAGLGTAALALGGEPLALGVAGMLYGVGFGAALPSLMAWTVDLVPAADRGRAMGTFFTAFELGIGAGAIGFGVLLGRTGFPSTFLAAGALALVGGALGAVRLRR